MNGRWLNQPQTLDLHARTTNKGKTHMVVKKEGNKCSYSNRDLEYFEGRNLEMGQWDLHINTNIQTSIFVILVTTTLIYISFSFEFQLRSIKILQL